MALLQKAYLGATPLFRNTSWFEDDTATLVNFTTSTTITASSTIHTKGSWTQVIASTSANTSLLLIGVNNFASATDVSTLLDFGTGDSGSEAVLVGDIAVGGHATVNANVSAYFAIPIKIASGTRLAARTQSLVASRQTVVRVYLFDMGDYAVTPSSVDVIGTDTATSIGTVMSGASGTWVQITASTSQAYRAVVIVPSFASNDVSQIQPLEYALGTGASGSEIEIGKIEVDTNAAEFLGIRPTLSPLIAKNIASGTRLAIKHNIPANPGRYAVTLIGIP
jgi:hypothetical protein